jgi:FMN phosphatase YigB (HAD superfamily)
MIVGDSLSSDILGGINAGIRTCHVDPTGEFKYSEIKPDYKIGYLRELPKLLETL